MASLTDQGGQTAQAVAAAERRAACAAHSRWQAPALATRPGALEGQQQGLTAPRPAGEAHIAVLAGCISSQKRPAHDSERSEIAAHGRSVRRCLVPSNANSNTIEW